VADRLLRLGVRIQLRVWTSVLVFVICCACSGICDELIARSEEYFRPCVCLILCDVETSTTRRPRHEFGRCVSGKEKFVTCYFYTKFSEFISVGEPVFGVTI